MKYRDLSYRYRAPQKPQAAELTTGAIVGYLALLALVCWCVFITATSVPEHAVLRANSAQEQEKG